MSNVLLSVVIPTYNRYEYLQSCLEVTSSIKSDQLEIVVQDNTEDNSEILPVIERIGDSRIKYYHIAEHISVVENSDYAVKHAIGKYICMIGDDDTICSSMLDAAAFCDVNSIEACMSLIPGFNWPGMTFSGKKEPNLFILEKATGEVIKIDAQEVLKHAVLSAEGLPRQMPRVYHGFVSKECLNKIYEKCGTFFPGPSPDMANATAVSLVVKKAVLIKDYLMVSGYGRRSARGEGNRKEHFGKISEKPWLPKDTESRWYPNIPKVFSGETIFAQSLIEALNLMDQGDLAKKYNFGSLYAMFFAHHPSARLYMLSFLLKRPYRLMWFIKGIFVRLKERRKMLSKNPTKNYVEEDAIQSLAEAQTYIYKLRVIDDVTDYFWK